MHLDSVSLIRNEARHTARLNTQKGKQMYMYRDELNERNFIYVAWTTVILEDQGQLSPITWDCQPIWARNPHFLCYSESEHFLISSALGRWALDEHDYAAWDELTRYG